MKQTIYIPTMARTDKQRTIGTLPKDYLDNVCLVCPAKEVATLEKNFKVKAVACPAKGISETRQWILDNAEERFVMMIDDDHDYMKRVEIDGKIKLRPMDKTETAALFEEMLCLARLYPMVGLSARQGNNYHTEEYLSIATRMHNQYALDRDVLSVNRIRFNKLPLMEDFYVNLSLLSSGYETAMIVNRCWGQQGSNAPGGCSTYRNPSLQKTASEMLQKEFPEFVKVKIKKTKGGWFHGQSEEARHDVHVQWKKAHQWGQHGAELGELLL